MMGKQKSNKSKWAVTRAEYEPGLRPPVFGGEPLIFAARGNPTPQSVVWSTVNQRPRTKVKIQLLSCNKMKGGESDVNPIRHFGEYLLKVWSVCSHAALALRPPLLPALKNVFHIQIVSRPHQIYTWYQCVHADIWSHSRHVLLSVFENQEIREQKCMRRIKCM